MSSKLLVIFFLIVSLAATSCQEATRENAPDTTGPAVNVEQEKVAILATINRETEAAFRRDYRGWQDYWVHAPYVAKTYMEMPDSSMSETLGWQAIDDFVRTYIEEHPEPDPVPTLVDDIDVRLYGDGAWVSFEQNDSVRGLKRETRLMEKVDGQWKIAGMHTTIYGFKREK